MGTARSWQYSASRVDQHFAAGPLPNRKWRPLDDLDAHLSRDDPGDGCRLDPRKPLDSLAHGGAVEVQQRPHIGEVEGVEYRRVRCESVSGNGDLMQANAGELGDTIALLKER